MKKHKLTIFPLILLTQGNAIAQKGNNPNVVLFLIDDLGWNDFACYGSKFYKTPTIDSLANAGVRFTDAYSSCTVSSPTRASIMTGKYPAKLHLTDWISGWNFSWAKLQPPNWTQYLPLEEKTIAEYLGDKGYKTWSIGKWHLGDDEKYWPQNQGFEVNIAGNFKGAPIKNKMNGCEGYFAPYCLPMLQEGNEGEYLTDRLTIEATNLIKSNDDSPFFLYMSHYAVHTPLAAKPEIQKRYEALADTSYIHNNATYAAMIESVDESLARVISAIKEKDKLDNTLFIITSDNGALNNISKSICLRNGKGSEYEGGVRVPFIISWTDYIKGGQVSNFPVISTDILPTILSACNIKKTKDIDGIDLLPLTQSEDLKKRPIFWHYPHYHTGGATPYSAVRFEDWKLILKYENNNFELYNLKTDLAEKNNLIKSNPNEANKLKKILSKWIKESKAQLPDMNPNYDENKERKTGPYLGSKG